MLVLGNFLIAIANILHGLVWFATVMVFARVILSWVNADPYNPIVRFILTSTDPLLKPLQQRFKLVWGSIDFTPLVLLLLLNFVSMFLVQTVADYGSNMRAQALLNGAMPR